MWCIEADVESPTCRGTVSAPGSDSHGVARGRCGEDREAEGLRGVKRHVASAISTDVDVNAGVVWVGPVVGIISQIDDVLVFSIEPSHRADVEILHLKGRTREAREGSSVWSHEGGPTVEAKSVEHRAKRGARCAVEGKVVCTRRDQHKGKVLLRCEARRAEKGSRHGNPRSISM